jgi:Undecaprenyl-phosphate galactose phosphotransferase WbaP
MEHGLCLVVDRLWSVRPFEATVFTRGIAGFQRAERLRANALLIADMAASVLTFLVAINGMQAFTACDAAVWMAVPICAAVLAGLHNRGDYSRRAALADEFGGLIRYSAYALLSHLLLNLTIFGQPYWQLLLAWIGLPLAAVGTRRLAARLLSRTGLWSVRTMLVGSDRAMEAVGSMLAAQPMTGLQLVGRMDRATLAAYSKPPSWDALLARHGASLVLVADEGDTAHQSVLRSLALARVPVIHAVVVHRMLHAGGASSSMPPFGINVVERLAKAVLDFVVTISMCLVLAPLLIGIAVVVRLDGGPALFRHERVGHGGRTFSCLKFRTMVVSGDAVLRELLARDPAAAQEWAATHKLRRDPRITPIGKFLRATSLDELPQLLNVLRGEMSLVGPRPVIVSELSRYGANAAYYLAWVPGLTGLWQVSGRSDTSYEQRVQLDTAYVLTWTFWNDLAILFRTVPAVLLKRGAI